MIHHFNICRGVLSSLRSVGHQRTVGIWAKIYPLQLDSLAAVRFEIAGARAVDERDDRLVVRGSWAKRVLPANGEQPLVAFPRSLYHVTLHLDVGNGDNAVVGHMRVW